MAQKKLDLLDELSQSEINIRRVRAICRENPGLIESAGLRLRVWSLLLLSSREEDTAFIAPPSTPCMEQHVLEADIRRTRANIEEYRSPEYQAALKNILQSFCLGRAVQYKQGMNEILAPFLTLQPPSRGTSSAYQLFDAFLLRYCERFVCQDDDSFLFKSFRLFQLLLAYHDPQLAIHLLEQGFPPELYSPQWFLTLFARSLPIGDVLRLWDLMIAWDDPAFTFFIGVCLLRRRRSPLLLASSDSIPEILRDLHLHDDREVDSVVSEAIVLYKCTPRCFTRCLRLCCVSTTELTPLPSHLRVKSHDVVNDEALDAQAVRQILMISALELISYLVPLNGSGAGDEGFQSTNHFVVVDLRSTADIESSGGGTIPRAVQIEPDFLESTDALEHWIEHFDGMRGHNIVIVDMPPVHATSGALWRRLLLGEGDGLPPTAAYYGLGKSAASNLASLLAPFQPFINQASLTKGTPVATTRDRTYNEIEKNAILDDSTRPAVVLARALQRNNFNLVSILDGGFPSLVETLLSSRGSVEPVIVDFNPDEWVAHLKATGRVLRNTKRISINARASISSLSRIKEMSEEERLLAALRVSRRLRHIYTENVILEQLKERGIDPE